MTQSNFGTIDPNAKSGTQLATDLNNWRDAMHSMHSGSSRPSYVAAGMMWLDNASSSLWLIKLYDGTDDTVIAQIDVTNNVSRVPGRRQEVVKTADYTLTADDTYVAIIMNKSGAATLNLPLLSGTANELYYVKNISTSDVTIDPNGSETIEGASTVVLKQNEGAWIWPASGKGSWRASVTRIVAATIDAWLYKGIGEIIYLDTSITGITAPATNNALYRYAELTAGLTGVGAYNENILTSESLSGSAPINLATAVVSLAGSPIDGQTIRLLNTEGRILRPSTSPGTLQNDQMQGHRHSTGPGQVVNAAGSGSQDFQSGIRATPLTTVLDPTTDGTNGTPRTGTETRMKNVGVKAYMRIK